MSAVLPRVTNDPLLSCPAGSLFRNANSINDLTFFAQVAERLRRAAHPMTQPELSGVVRDVMRYFVQHPLAADSLEGIARWRLLEQRACDLVAETSSAVAMLVGEGMLEEVAVAGGKTLYRLNPAKIDAARQFLEHSLEDDRA